MISLLSRFVAKRAAPASSAAMSIPRAERSYAPESLVLLSERLVLSLFVSFTRFPFACLLQRHAVFVSFYV